MVTYDTLLLENSWEDMRKLLASADHSHSMDLSPNCYVKFGTYGITVYKFRKQTQKWYRKIVNDWKNLTYNDFYEQFKELPWEVTE